MRGRRLVEGDLWAVSIAGQQALQKGGGRRSSQTRKKKMGAGKGFKGFHLWMCDVDMVGILTNYTSGTRKNNKTKMRWQSLKVPWRQQRLYRVKTA
jgi:hypothetical protein